jgi:hypothetical protein
MHASGSGTQYTKTLRHSDAFHSGLMTEFELKHAEFRCPAAAGELPFISLVRWKSLTLWHLVVVEVASRYVRGDLSRNELGLRNLTSDSQ